MKSAEKFSLFFEAVVLILKYFFMLVGKGPYIYCLHISVVKPWTFLGCTEKETRLSRIPRNVDL